MQAALCMCAILAALPVCAGERMTVSVCTRGHLDEKLVAGAQVALTDLFQTMDIEVAWAKCELGLQGDEAVEQHWYTVRLRDGRPFIPPALAALDTLGEAFTSIDQPGYIVEVYYDAVLSVAFAKQIEPRALLGYVMAHELAHLMLGPRHSHQGIMRAAWNSFDLAAMRQGCLRFTPAEAARLRELLHNSVDRASTPVLNRLN